MSDLYLFQNALRDLLRPKKLIVAFVLIAIPSLLALFIRFKSHDYRPEEIYGVLVPGLVFGFILVILAVVFGSGVVSQEIEQKTIVYLLTRPVPRWRILLMKFAAAVIVITLTSWLATLAIGLVLFGFGGADSSENLLTPSDVKDGPAFVARFRDSQDPLSSYLRESLSDQDKFVLAVSDAGAGVSPGDVQGAGLLQQGQGVVAIAQLRSVLSALNRVIQHHKSIYTPERFAQAHLSESTRRQIEEHPTGKALNRLNRALLSDAYSDLLIQPRTAAEWVSHDLWVLPLGALAYGGLFLFLATILNRPLLYGLVFAFGWESWVPNMPGDFNKVSLMSYLRALAPHAVPPDVGALSPQTITSGTAWVVLIGFSLFILAAACVIFSTNEYVPREDAE